MRLQARSVCAAAGVPKELEDACVQGMITKGRITVEQAKVWMAKVTHIGVQGIGLQGPFFVLSHYADDPTIVVSGGGLDPAS